VETPEGDKEGSNAWIIVVIILGSLVGIALVLGVVHFVYTTFKKPQYEYNLLDNADAGDDDEYLLS